MSFSYLNARPRSPVEFSQYSDDFYLNQDGVLCKKDIPRDDQAIVDSYFDTRLEAILDMYSETIAGMQGYNVDFTDDVVDIDQRRSALDQILAVDQMLDEYRAADPELSQLSREALVAKLQSAYKGAVDAYFKKLKGDNGDAQTKETQPEGEQA